MILFSTTVLLGLLFVFYLVGTLFFVAAAKEANLLARRCLRKAAWAALAGGVFYDLGHLHLHRPISESLVRVATICVGVSLGFFLSAQTVRRANRDDVPR
jgi:hypothetical protein